MTVTYRPLPAATAVARSFAITVGLSPGYTASEPERSVAAAVAVHTDWMWEKITAGQPYLPGVFTPAVISYAWPRPDHGGVGGCAAEPGVVFSGEVSVLYQADLTDGNVVSLLNELAARFGEALDQTRVYVRFRDATWVLEAEEA